MSTHTEPTHRAMWTIEVDGCPMAHGPDDGSYDLARMAEPYRVTNPGADVRVRRTVNVYKVKILKRYAGHGVGRNRLFVRFGVVGLPDTLPYICDVEVRMANLSTDEARAIAIARIEQAMAVVPQAS